MHIERIKPGRVAAFSAQHASSRYERFQRTHIIGRLLPFALWDFAANGASRALPDGDYALVVDGFEAARLTVTGSPIPAAFDSPAMAPGWRRLQIRMPDGTLSPSWFAHAGNVAVDGLAPVCSGSYEWTHDGAGWAVGATAEHRWEWVDAKAKPTPAPLDKRAFVAFSEPVKGGRLMLRDLAPGVGTRRVCSYKGIPTTMGRQSYFWEDLIAKKPVLPLLDGPRGVATVGMVTHISVGTGTQTAAPGSTPVGALYVLDPWRLMRVSADGSVRTLVGFRHPVAPSWEDQAAPLDLVGDWSAVPPERRQMREAWGFTWLPETLGVDSSAAPIPAEGNRQPHVGNPTAVIANTRMNTLLRVEFDGRSHATPAKVMELASLSDPWDVVSWRDELIVSERGQHRIIALDRTGKLKRVIVQGSALASVSPVNRFVTRLSSLASCRAAPCVAPEGLSVLGDWLYFASVAQAQISRINLVTGEAQVVGAFFTDMNSHFAKIAVSDGSFGPAGTVFVVTWSINDLGFPVAILPDGARWTYNQFADGAPMTGTGPNWGSGSYASGVGVGGGRLVFGGAGQALRELSLAHPDDPAPDIPRLRRAAAKLDPLLYRPGGFNPFGLPLPDDPDVAYAASLYRFTAPTGPTMPDHTASLDTIDASLTAAATAAATIRQSSPVVELDQFDASLAGTRAAAQVLRTALTPVAPPPDPQPGGFASVTQTRSSAVVDAPDAAGPKVVLLHLHASGGTIPPTGGSVWQAELNPALSIEDSHVLKWHATYDNSVPVGQTLGFKVYKVMPEDRHGTYPGGSYRQSAHYGWSLGSGAQARTYNIAWPRFDALLDYVEANTAGLSSTRVCLVGYSIGAWGGARYGLRRPDQIPAVYLSRPRWRYSQTVGTYQLSDYYAGTMTYPAGATPALASGPGSLESDADMIAYTLNTANPLPWIGWTIGRRDGFADFGDHIAMIDALKATGRAFAVAWNNGDHGGGDTIHVDIVPAVPYGLIERGKGYPRFFDCSADKDPRVDLIGGINLGLGWRNVVETPTGWSCEVRSRLSACTVKVLPHASKVFTAAVQPQTVTIPAAMTWVPVSFTA